jgi:hypothetical protein
MTTTDSDIVAIGGVSSSGMKVGVDLGTDCAAHATSMIDQISISNWTIAASSGEIASGSGIGTGMT